MAFLPQSRRARFLRPRRFQSYGSPSAQTTPAEAIGVVSASGHFTLEGAEIWGNSTLFDGARIETNGASSQLALSNGVKVQLAAGSVAEVHRNRLVLKRGIGQVTAPAGAQSGYEVGVAGFNIISDGGRFQVGVDGESELLVASLDGTARVRQGAGLLASITAGQKRSFALLQDLTRTGCLLYKNGGFILQVDDSPEVLQLNGPDLPANVGNRVEVQGVQSSASATIAPATSVVIVSAVAPQSQGGCLTAAAALNAQASMPAQATTAVQTPAAQPTTPTPGTAPSPAQVSTGGMSTGAKVAIVGAIAGGGAGAALAFSSSKKSTSP